MPGRIADLSGGDLRSRLRSGLILDSGAVATRVRSTLPEVEAAIRRAYGAYPVADAAAFADFFCTVRGGRGVRRWIGRQAMPDVGGPAPFIPLPAAMAGLAVESALNWCVATGAHWLLIFHAAVVERSGRALILPGETGQGKSTLCAALVASGWRLLSDEFCLLDLDSGRIHPNVRPISLKNRSIGVIGEFVAARGGKAGLTPPIEGTPKGTIAYLPPDAATVDRRAETAAPLAVAFPHYRPDEAPALEVMPKARAFIRVVASSVNYEIQGEAAFHAMGDFMDRHPTYLMAYPDLDTALDLVERIAARGAGE